MQTTAKYRTLAAKLQAELDAAAGASSDASKASDAALAAAQTKVEQEHMKWMATRMQTAAIRMAHAKAMDDRRRLGASLRDEMERSTLLASQVRHSLAPLDPPITPLGHAPPHPPCC